MRPDAHRLRIAAAAAIVAAAALTTASFADMTVQGDRAAWAAITAAYQKLNTLSGYRMKMAGGPGGQAMVIEVVPPDKYHSTVQMAQGTMETVTVGGETRFRMNIPGAPNANKWQCQGAPRTPGLGDPTKAASGTVEASRGPDTAIDGVPVHTYVYTLTSSAAGQRITSKLTLYVGAQNGLPRRQVMMVGGQPQMIDFYDYGANIAIALPPCG